MSIKSNICTLRSWISEKVKESFEYKEQVRIENLEAKTKQTVISKWIPKTNGMNEIKKMYEKT